MNKRKAGQFAKVTLVTLAAGLFAYGEAQDSYKDTVDAAARLGAKDIPVMMATPAPQRPSPFDNPVTRGLLKVFVETVAKKGEERRRASELAPNMKAEDDRLGGNRPIYSHLG